MTSLTERMHGAEPHIRADALHASVQAEMGKLLAEKGRTHGNFPEVARLAQELKRVCWVVNPEGWGRLSLEQAEAVETMFTNIAKIIAGDPNHIEHWRKLAGYPSLIMEMLP